MSQTTIPNTRKGHLRRLRKMRRKLIELRDVAGDPTVRKPVHRRPLFKPNQSKTLFQMDFSNVDARVASAVAASHVRAPSFAEMTDAVSRAAYLRKRIKRAAFVTWCGRKADSARSHKSDLQLRIDGAWVTIDPLSPQLKLHVKA